MKKLLSLLVVALTLVGFANVASAQEVTKKKVKTNAGVVYEVTTTKSATGEETSKISAVFAEVKTATGAIVEIPVTNSTLVGATISGVSGSSATNIVITPAGSTTALTPAQVVTTLNAAIPAAVTAAVAQNIIPANTPPPPVVTVAAVISAPVITPPAPVTTPPPAPVPVVITDTAPKQSVSPDQVTSGSKP
jgi:hypothetical protein